MYCKSYIILLEYIYNENRGDFMKKAIKWIVLVIILIIAIGIGIFVVKDMKQEDTLREEMLAFENLTRAETIDVEQIEQRIRELKTTGDYGIVEKAVKEYLADGVNASIEVADILNDERLVNILTPENYKEDGPEFVQTKQFLQEAKEKVETNKAKLVELLSEEKVMSYIEGKNIDQYYIDLYKELALAAESSTEEDKQEVETAMNEVTQMLEIQTQIINFLAENKQNWEIQDDTIVFNSQALQNQYNDYINQL